ncbi:MAG: YaiI/YqxD family protein [Aureliella sp.]
MKIWIDADACPQAVKQIVFRASKRVQAEVVLVANQLIQAPKAYQLVSSVIVNQDANAADRYIVENAAPGDIAITADLPLAGDLVAGKVFVIDPRGDEYSPDTIASRLSMRNFMDDLRGSGMVTGGAAPYGELDKKAFASTFDRLLTRAMRTSN